MEIFIKFRTSDKYYWLNSEIKEGLVYNLQDKYLIEDKKFNRHCVKGIEYFGNGSLKQAIELMELIESIEINNISSTSQIFDILFNGKGISAKDLRGHIISHPPIGNGFDYFVNYFKDNLKEYFNYFDLKFFEKVFEEDIIRKLKKINDPNNFGCIVNDKFYIDIINKF